MGIVDIIKNMGNREEQDDLPDDVTRDRYLRSLRRQRRIQMEEIEKERLKAEIAAFNKERMRRHLFGIQSQQQMQQNQQARPYHYKTKMKKNRSPLSTYGCGLGKGNI